jgi:hypothetical protein
VEPSEALKEQTAERLGEVDYGVSFITMADFYKYGCTDSVIILDEYDSMVQD